MVAFKDPILAEKMPEWSLHNSDGSIFRDKSGLAWVNPYRKEVWEYLASVGEAAITAGFDEVQYDYVRFSTDSRMKQVDFGDSTKGRTKPRRSADLRCMPRRESTRQADGFLQMFMVL